MLGSTQGVLSQSVAATPVRPSKRSCTSFSRLKPIGKRLADFLIFQRRVAFLGMHVEVQAFIITGEGVDDLDPGFFQLG